MESTERKDERKHERKPLEVTVDWRVIGSDDVIWSATNDISAGGLRIRTLSPPEVGTTLVVILGTATDPAHHTLRVPAKVAWTRMDDAFCGMGVAFELADDAVKQELDAALRELAPPPK